MKFLFRNPSAWMPIVLSIGTLAWILILLSINGIPTPDQNKDEGTAAHIFQLWLVLEVFMIGFFAIKWLPQKPKEAIVVLLIQILFVILACSPVFLLQL